MQTGFGGCNPILDLPPCARRAGVDAQPSPGLPMSASASELTIDGAGSNPDLLSEDLATQATLPAREPAGERLRKVLYIEDNPANLMLVGDLIARRADIQLLSARDGNSGIDLARASQPEVILMDINLPGISGIEALAILQQDPATAHIPVVAVSANAMPRDIEKGLQAGFFRYLTKPIKVPEFMTTLDLALAHAQATATAKNTQGAQC
jgi:CheY-like chemotaxis protein